MPSSDNRAARNFVHRLCADALLLALSLILSYIEAILPLQLWIPLPGFRLGLAQMVITSTYFLIGRSDAALISATRVLLMGLLFGSFTSTLFSAFGALLSYLGLILSERLLRHHASYLGLGIFCASLHNFGQLTAAALLFGMEVFWSYLPFLLLAALFFGALSGALLNQLVPRLSPILQERRHLP